MNAPIVRVKSRTEDGNDFPVDAFLIAESDQWLLIEPITYNLRTDWLSLIRKTFVDGVEAEFDRKGFLQTVATLKHLQGRSITLDLERPLNAILADIQGRFGAFTLFLGSETIVGQVHIGSDSVFTIRTIGEDRSVWIRPAPIRYADVRRVDFADEYVRTLIQVCRSSL